MEFYFALALLIVLVTILIYFNNRMYLMVQKELKKMQGDSQQIKTSQRASQKRERRIESIFEKDQAKKKKTKFDF